MNQSILHVAAGILVRKDGAYLLAQRPEGAIYGGWWEFPGGKIEKGETSEQALVRELHEELDIDASEVTFWRHHEHLYDHVYVHLEIFKVRAWMREVSPLYHQNLHWWQALQPWPEPVLAANYPLLNELKAGR